MQRSIRRLIFIFCLGSLSGAAHARLLSADQRVGTTELERAGARQSLNLNDPLIESDTVRTGADGRLSLRLANQGVFELGAGAELVIERLPYASFAPDLTTVLRLKRGFLRVVWNHPAQAGIWPLLVQVGAQSASLTQGEYFFEAGAPVPASTACVASGAIGLKAENHGDVTLHPSRCYFLENQSAHSVEYAEGDWTVLRNQGALRAPQPAAAAVVRKPDFEIQNLPAAPLLMHADSVPLESTTTETLFGEKEPDLSGMLAAAKTRPASAAAASAPAAVNPAPAAAKKSGATRWVLQVVAATTPAKAEREAKKLRAGGYTPEIETTQVNGKTWHRVRIAGFASAADARKTAEEIKSKLGYANGWIAKVR